MDKGTKVFRAYVVTIGSVCVESGIISGIVANGEPLVSWAGMLTPFSDNWRASKTEAKRDAQAALIRQIGELQAKADAMHDEILHEILTTEEVAA